MCPLKHENPSGQTQVLVKTSRFSRFAITSLCQLYDIKATQNLFFFCVPFSRERQMPLVQASNQWRYACRMYNNLLRKLNLNFLI